MYANACVAGSANFSNRGSPRRTPVRAAGLATSDPLYLQYASGRVPTAASPSNTTSSSSSATGSQSGTMSTSISNNPNAPSEQLSRTNLYIRGLPHTTTDKDLVTMCIQ